MHADFDGLVLQGGGCRCFFTLGFLHAAAPALGAVREIAAVSASSAMACAHALSAHREALECFAARVRNNPRNFYPERFLSGRDMIPHHAMYRDALREVVSEAAFARLRSGPRVRILVGAGPGPSRSLATALAAVAVVRGRTPRALRAHIIDVHELRHRDDLVDAVLSSSAFPPFTPLPLHNGRALIDGGAVEPVPLSVLGEARRPLIVLTRPQPPRPLPPGVARVAPSAPLGVSTWQYADEPALRRVYEAGLRTGDRFVREGATTG